MNMIKEFSVSKMTVKIFDTRKSMGEVAAREVADGITKLLAVKPEINMIFAAAPSQNEFLAELTGHDEIDWGRINAFHMDEYVGLPGDAPQGFGNFLRDRIFERVAFKSVNYIDGNARDIDAECERYSGLLAKFPPDIVCMGIGENGHIAFNDPHVARFDDSSLVKKVELDDRCRLQQVNDGCFEDIKKVPTHALTLTIPALVNCRQICCVVPGKTKSEAVFNVIKNGVSEGCPASILKTCRNTVLYLDRDSAERIL